MQTDKMIQSLAAQLQPVQRLRSPLLRALLWLAVVGAIAALLIAHAVGLTIFQLGLFAPLSFRAEGGGVYGRSFIAAGAMMSLIALSQDWNPLWANHASP